MINRVPESVDGRWPALQPSAMTVLRLPVHGRWAWDARGDSRAVRVSAHTRENVVNLSVWRDEICVGTVRLRPAEAASLVAGLSDGIAELADRADHETLLDEVSGDTATVRELELRLARLESRLASTRWRTAVSAATQALRRGGRRP
jgi:hypothetical protein